MSVSTSLAPVLFLSHGAPTLVIDPVPAQRFLKTLAQQVPRPRAIVVVSAHWQEDQPAVGIQAVNDTIHDFGGFPDALYRITWPAPGDAEVSELVLARLAAAGFEPTPADRGLDHGAWVPLSLAWPAADVPVVPVSLVRGGFDEHLRLGAALSGLREQGVLICCTGSATHPLAAAVPGIDQPTPWVAAFDRWLADAVMANDLRALRAWLQVSDAHRVHPSDDHLLPLFVALGAAGAQSGTPRVHLMHHSWTWRVLSMACWRWD